MKSYFDIIVNVASVMITLWGYLQVINVKVPV